MHRSLHARWWLLPLCMLLMISLAHCAGSRECFYDTDCPGDKICKENKCVNSSLSVKNCSADKDCAKGYKCQRSLCVIVPTGYKPTEPEPRSEPEPKIEPVPEEKPVVREEPKIEPIPEDAGPELPVDEGPVDQGPKACKKDADCGNGTHCRPDTDGKLLCASAYANGKSLGEDCKEAKDCKTGLCHPNKLKCTKVCEVKADCPSQSCEEQTFGKNKVNVCFPGGNQCQSNADCGQGQNCRLVVLSASLIATRCETPPIDANLKPGQECTDRTKCQSNVCQDAEYCSAMCNEDKHCPSGYTCRSEKINYGGKDYTFSVCKASTCIPCQKDLTCMRGSQVCVPKDQSGKIGLCCEASPGKRDGETCTKNSDCAGQICLPTTKRCSSVCNTSQDCVLPGGAVCDTIAVKIGAASGTQKVCLPKLTLCNKTKSDKDCTAKDTGCAPRLDDRGTFAFQCVETNPKGKAIGDTCTKDSDCESALCYMNACARLCVAVADCPTNFTCQAATFTSTGKPNLSAKACRLPAGGIPCKTDADCTLAQADTCRIVPQGGKLELRCRPKAQGTKKVGDTCANDNECASGTCLKPENICTAACLVDKDCGGALSCQERNFGSGSATAKFKVCGVVRCKGDKDCKNGQVCAYVASGSNGFLKCVALAGTLKALGCTCAKDSDCASNLCGPGKFCMAPCDGGDTKLCPLQYSCEKTATGPNLTSSTKLNLCQPVPNGCGVNADCKTSGQLCVLSYDTDKRPLQQCKTKAGSLKPGDACDPARTDQCETGVCSPTNRQCSVLCSQDSDCSSGKRCSDTVFAGQWTLRICREADCVAQSQCGSSEVCQININPLNNQVSTKCAKPATGTKKLGDACDASKGFPGECGNRFCDAQSKKCVAVCTSDRHCKSNETCKRIAVTQNVQSRGCVVGKRTSCGNTKDCNTGEICQVQIVGGNLRVSCQKSTGDKAGSTCDPSQFPGTCASQLCDPVSKKCLDVCQPGLNDCASGEVCGKVAVGNYTVNACTPPAIACKRQSDCASGTVCAPVVNNARVEYLCLRPEAGIVKNVGQTCDPAKGYKGECRTHLCEPQTKVCANTCEKDTDCTTSQRCGKIEIAGQLVRSCIPDKARCVRDATCPATQPYCTLELNVQGNIFRQCSTGGPGTKKYGEVCDASKKLPGDCLNRLCEEGLNRCVQTCDKNSHCPQGLVCAETRVERSKKVKACVPPRGSLCQRNKDCPYPFVCQVNRTATGISQTCQPSNVGKQEGQLCDSNKGLPGECANHACNPNSKICSALCSSNTDCVNGSCREVTVQGYKFKVCDDTCKSTKDCPSGQLCTIKIRDGKTVRACTVPTSTRPKKVGEVCAPTKGFPGECQTSFCSIQTKKCLAVCTVDSECPTGTICDTTFFTVGNNNDIKALGCVPATGSCTKSIHCSNNHVCQVQLRNSKYVLSCSVAPQPTGKAEAQTCDPKKTFPGDCQSRICEPKSKLCTRPCEVDKDCSTAFGGNAARTKCGTVTVGTLTVKACVEP